MNPSLAAMLAAAALVQSAYAEDSPPTPPVSFGVAGRSAILTVHAEGAQVYECLAKAGGALAWSFREPIATLMSDGKTIGRHFVGPTWQFADGDTVIGKTAATAPGAVPGDVALLKLDAVSHPASGPLQDAAIVLRLNTHGGGLSGVCASPHELRAVPYSADYQFLR